MSYLENIGKNAKKAFEDLKNVKHIKIKKVLKDYSDAILKNKNNIQLARGLSSFSSDEINKIKGKQSKEIEKILGYLSKTEIIHKDDMVLL